jgi:DNA-binding transcriptional MerR regulator
MDIYPIGKVAAMLNLSTSTIRNYAEQAALEPFLSEIATRTGAYKGAKERNFIMDDIIVMNTARIHKTSSSTWNDVAQLLESGHRESELPLAAQTLMPETRAEAFQLVVQSREQLKIAEQRYQDLEQEIMNMEQRHRDELAAEREAHKEELAAEREARRREYDELMREKLESREEIGVLKFILKQNNIDPSTGKRKEE